MNNRGFSGISFPFRFDGKGRVAVSTTSVDDFSHIKEGLQQVIGTAIGERIMELEFGSEVNKQTFVIAEDETEKSILKFYIKEAIQRWDKRVKVIDIRVNAMMSDTGDSYTYAEVDFEVLKYMKSDTVSVKVGGGLIEA